MRLMYFKEFYSVITNGEVEFEVQFSKNFCGIDPGSHIFGQDGYGNIFIDGKPARTEIRIREEDLSVCQNLLSA